MSGFKDFVTKRREEERKNAASGSGFRAFVQNKRQQEQNTEASSQSALETRLQNLFAKSEQPKDDDTVSVYDPNDSSIPAREMTYGEYKQIAEEETRKAVQENSRLRAMSVHENRLHGEEIAEAQEKDLAASGTVTDNPLIPTAKSAISRGDYDKARELLASGIGVYYSQRQAEELYTELITAPGITVEERLAGLAKAMERMDAEQNNALAKLNIAAQNRDVAGSMRAAEEFRAASRKQGQRDQYQQMYDNMRYDSARKAVEDATAERDEAYTASISELDAQIKELEGGDVSLREAEKAAWQKSGELYSAIDDTLPGAQKAREEYLLAQEEAWAAQQAVRENEAQIFYANGLKTFAGLSESDRVQLAAYVRGGEYKETYKRLKSSMNKDDFERMVETVAALENSVKSAERDLGTVRFANEHPVMGSIASVFTSLVGGVSAVAGVAARGIDNLGEADGYKAPIDVNSLAFAPTKHATVTRGTVAENIEREVGGKGGKVASFLYQTGMSGVDSLAASFTGNWGGALLLGTSSASNAFLDAKERGASDSQAIWTGLFAGAFETLFERVSIGNLNALKETPVGTIKDILKNAGRSALVNASEEAFTEAATAISDYLVNGDLSVYGERYQAYLEQYGDEQKAKDAAMWDMLKDIGIAGAGGLVMGVGMSGAVGGIQYVSGKNRDAAYKKALSFAEQVDSVLAGTHEKYLDLYVSETPAVLTKLGFLEGPLLMRNGKVNEILTKHSEMSAEIIKQVPEALQKPLTILKSKTHPQESVVVITEVATKKGEMIVPVWVNQEGTYMNVELGGAQHVNTNFVASTYGRNVKELLKYAAENEGILYVSENKKRVEQLFARNGLQLPTPLKLSNSNIRIAQDDPDVNNNFMQMSANNTGNAKEEGTMLPSDTAAEDPRERVANTEPSANSISQVGGNSQEGAGISATGENIAAGQNAVQSEILTTKSPRFEEAKGIFEKNVGTREHPATQMQLDEYVNYAYRYAYETNVKGNKEFPKQKESLEFGIVSNRAVEEIQRHFGVDISEHENVINDNDIRHIKNSHGEDTNEKYPVTAEDIKKIPDIVENFDDILYVSRKDGKAGIVYVKRHNGVTYYLEQIRDGKTLRGKQMIKTSTGTIPDLEGLEAAIHKKWGTTPLQMANAPRMYVQDVWNDTAVNSISQLGGNSQGAIPAIEHMAKTVGRVGGDTMRRFYNGDMSEIEYAESFLRYYNAGKNGRPVDFEQAADALNPAQREAAYNAGIIDAKADAAKNKAAPGTLKVAADVKVSRSFVRRVEKLAKALNVSITIGGKAPVENGVQDRGYITSDGHIHIYGDATVKLEDGRVLKGEQAALMIVLGHEMTHRLQALDEDSYNRFSDYVLSIRGMSDTVHSLMETGNWSKEKAEEEAVCDFAMQYLFTDKKTIREVTRKHSKVAEIIRSVLEWIYEQLGMGKYSDMSYSEAEFAKIIDEAARLWNEAYNASLQNVKNGVETKNTTEGGVKYSAIRLDTDGNEFVDVDITTMVDATHTGEQIANILSDIVKTKFTDFVKVNGQKIGINQKTAREWHMSKSAQSLKRLDYGMFLDKANTFNNADELLKVAKNYIGEAKKHTRKDNFVEFARGVVNFKVGANGYAADIIVGTTKSGVAILYDIVNIQKKKIASMPDTTQNRRLGTLANNNVPQKAPVVNSQSMKNSQNDASAEQKSQSGTEDILFENLKKQYGTIKPGENPARDVELPTKSADGKTVSQTVRTIMEAEATPDEMIPTLEQLVAEGGFSYETITDKEAIAEAEAEITENGFKETLTSWYQRAGSGKEISKHNTALGFALYNAAANAGDTQEAIKILDALAQHQRAAAQALQATRILKKMSPLADLYYAEMTIEKLQGELEKRYKKEFGEKGRKLKIDAELAEKVRSGKTEAEKREAMKDIYRDIGRQIPSTFVDKWTAWRYLAMLGNVRTHVRNILGNTAFAVVTIPKNTLATLGEMAFIRDRSKRTKAFVSKTFSRSDAALMKAASLDYENVRDGYEDGGKYTDSLFVNKYVEEGRRIFKTKPLEALRRANNALLDGEDAKFARMHYARALAGFCKARGITAQQIESGEGIQAARDYAMQEALKATFRDRNKFSDAVARMGRSSKVVSLAGDAALPYRRTPANILVRGLEYSPAGLVYNAAADAVHAAKGEQVTAAQVMDHLASGLTGTAILGLGVWLAFEGIVRGIGGDDEKEKEFAELMGHQQYALEIGDTSVTLDWLAPAALPFFVGVNLAEMMQKDGLTLAEATTAFMQVTEPILEMSCLQSLTNLLDSGFSEDAVLQTAIDMTTSYITQAIPTLFGQIERTWESERMTTYTDKNNYYLSPDMQYAIGKISQRLPGDYSQIPYIDAWGRTESSGGVGVRAANNMLNPAYTSKISESDMEKELLRLYEQTGEPVLPSRADKSFPIGGEQVYLTAEQYQAYATGKGQVSYKLATAITGAKAYAGMDDYQKAEAISLAYTYANAIAKRDATAKLDTPYKIPNTLNWVKKAEAGVTNGVSVAEFILAKAAISDIDGGYTDIRTGDTIENSESLRKMEAIYAIDGLTESKRKYLFEALGVGKSVRHYNKACVAEQLAKMRKKAGM